MADYGWLGGRGFLGESTFGKGGIVAVSPLDG
jgi:hypothetical protein